VALISRLILALVVAIVVWLICTFVGDLVSAMNVPIAGVVGGFLKTYAVVLAILAFLWQFFAGGFTVPTLRR
jgi:hypothetical protein